MKRFLILFFVFFAASLNAEQFFSTFSNGQTHSLDFTYTVNYADFQVHGVDPNQHKRYKVTATLTASGGEWYVSGGYSNFSRGGGGTEVQSAYMPIGFHTYSVRKYDSGYSDIGSTVIAVSDPDVPQPQTVTITPTEAQTTLGAPVSFTASGGKNGYTWQMDAGVTYTVTLTGGGSETVAVVGAVAGTYSIAVSSAAGNGWAESNVASASLVIADAVAYFVKVNETNTTAHTIRYRVLWKGTVLDTFTLAPGLSYRQRYQVEDSTPGSIEYQVVGAEDTGAVWIKKEGDNPVFIPGPPLPPVQESVSNPPPPPTTVQTSTDPGKLPGSSTSGSGGGGLWQTINGGNKGNGVNAEQMAEGIDKLVREVKEMQDIMKGEAQNGTGFPSEAPEGAALAPSAEANAISGAVEELMPSSISLPLVVGQNGVWEIPIAMPYLGEIGFGMDLTRFASSVSAFRAAMLACECIAFFFASVAVIRSAFAS